MIFSRCSTVSLLRFIVLPIIVEFSELDAYSPCTVGPSSHVEGAGGFVIEMIMQSAKRTVHLGISSMTMSSALVVGKKKYHFCKDEYEIKIRVKFYSHKRIRILAAPQNTI